MITPNDIQELKRALKEMTLEQLLEVTPHIKSFTASLALSVQIGNFDTTTQDVSLGVFLGSLYASLTLFGDENSSYITLEDRLEMLNTIISTSYRAALKFHLDNTDGLSFDSKH